MAVAFPSASYRVRLLTGVLALSLALLVSNTAVCADNCGSLERLAVALRFAQAVYPELKDRELSVSFSEGSGTFVSGATEADGFMMRVGEPIWTPPGETVDQYYAAELGVVRSRGIELPLNLSFSFVKVGPSIKQRQLACQPLNFSGEVGYEQMQKVQSAIDSHPEWSDAQELDVARKLGLRYGPEEKRAVLKNLPLHELTEFYGKLRIKSADFSMDAGQKCAGCRFVLPRWHIVLSMVNKEKAIGITVEPFFGRITAISE